MFRRFASTFHSQRAAVVANAMTVVARNGSTYVPRAESDSDSNSEPVTAAASTTLCEGGTASSPSPSVQKKATPSPADLRREFPSLTFDAQGRILEAVDNTAVRTDHNSRFSEPLTTYSWDQPKRVQLFGFMEGGVVGRFAQPARISTETDEDEDE